MSRYLDHRLGTFARWPLLWSLWSAKGRLSSPNAIVPLPRLDHVGSIRGPGNQSVGVELLLSEESVRAACHHSSSSTRASNSSILSGGEGRELTESKFRQI